MVCVSFYVICIVERLVSSVICRFQGLSYSHVPECIEFSFILFIHHNIHFYFELCTYCNILDIYLSWWILLNIFLYGTIEFFILWHVWRYSGVLWVNSCPPLTRPHQAVMHECALLHHWLCNQKHPWGICSCSPIVNFLKVTFYHGMVTYFSFKNNLNRHIKHENLLSIYENMDYFQIMLFTVTCWKFQKIQQPYIKRYFYVFFSTNIVEILLKLWADASSGSSAVKAFLQGSPSPSPSPSPSSSLLFSIFA